MVAPIVRVCLSACIDVPAPKNYHMHCIEISMYRCCLVSAVNKIVLRYPPTDTYCIHLYVLSRTVKQDRHKEK